MAAQAECSALPEQIPSPWRSLLRGAVEDPAFSALDRAVTAARQAGEVYPAPDRVFYALERTPPQAVKAVILGQDPYHEPGQAMGLSFSVPRGTAIPPSLRNIFKELQTDLGVPPAPDGDLTRWADQGVLLLNAVLTVGAGQALSHEKLGWQAFTDKIILALAELPQPIAFVLWGRQARQKAALTRSPYPRLVVESAHPSPLSASRGFFGSRPFSRVNDFLRRNGAGEIRW